MSAPISVDLPHNLGAEEAKRRIGDNIGKLKDHIPGGSADVRSSWEGDQMNLFVQAMGQEVTARLDVQDTVVRVEIVLPGMLGFFGNKVAGLLRSKGGALLEDRSKKG